MSFNKFQLDCLKAHNEYRARHGCPPLQLDHSICNHAQEWAEQIARMNCLQHRMQNRRYGENIYMCMGKADLSGQEPVQSWYKEIDQHRFGREQVSMSTGHFTQVVWKNSKRLGVGKARNGNSIYVVANYDPPGNFMGEFRANVTPPY